MAPILPFLAEELYQNLIVAVVPEGRLADSVHLTRWPAPEMAALRDEGLERSMADCAAGRGARAHAPLPGGHSGPAAPGPGVDRGARIGASRCRRSSST